MIYKRVVTEKIKVINLFSKLEIEDREDANLNVPFPLGVKTPYGFKNIVTAFRTKKQKVVTTYFKNNTTLKTSEDHLLKANGEWKKVKDITKDDIIETENGTTSVVKKHSKKNKYTKWKEEILYDISVEDVHCYYSNGIVSHNSWFLSRIGAEAMRQGKNVMHFTMELNEKYVGLRYDACFSGIAFQEVRKNVQQIKDALATIPGKLFIKYFPIKTASASTLKMHIDRFQLITGIKIDLVIVDYADLLRPLVADKNANSYSDGGSVYEELRGMLGELQVPGWTASQSNRGAHEEEVIGAGNVAESYKKIMTGDFILSLSRKTEDKLAGSGRVHVMKNRFGPDGQTYVCAFDTSCGKICIYDKDSVEGLEILSKAKTAQESIKDILGKAWKKTHGDDNDANSN